MYADKPFNPYIINSLKLLISSSLVAKTPTLVDFSSNSLFISSGVNSFPLPNIASLILLNMLTLTSISAFELAFHNAASDKLCLLLNCANKSSFVFNVSFTLA